MPYQMLCRKAAAALHLSRAVPTTASISRSVLVALLIGLVSTYLGGSACAASTRLGNEDTYFSHTDITQSGAGDAGTANTGSPHADTIGTDSVTAGSVGTGSTRPDTVDTSSAGASSSGSANTNANSAQPAGAAHTTAPAYSAAGLYNLANTYARAGKPGMAVLNYERARLLAPNDPDIEANLRWVRSSVKLPADPPTRFERIVTVASPTTLSWIGLSGLLIAGGSLLAGRAYPRWLRRIGMLLGLTLIGLTLGNAVALWPRLHAAVVLTNATPVRVSPVPMGDPAFTLPEAETVSITAEHEGFVLIRTRAGRTGWVSNANLAPVVPRP